MSNHCVIMSETDIILFANCNWEINFFKISSAKIHEIKFHQKEHYKIPSCDLNILRRNEMG